MAAYKIAAEAGDALSQYQVGMMYCYGQGVAVDYKQARPWIEKAVAQDYSAAVGQLVADAGIVEVEHRLMPSERMVVQCDLLLLEES